MFILAIYLSKFKNTLRDWVRWLMPLVSVLRRQRQTDLCGFGGQPGLQELVPGQALKLYGETLSPKKCICMCLCIEKYLSIQLNYFKNFSK